VWLIASALLLCAATCMAAPRVQQLAPNLYAYVSDNDHSANSTFLVGQHGILVVDTGLNRVEGEKLLAEIRKISSLPVQFIVNTHYHTDHQGGNGVVGPEAIVISSPFTRERTLQAMAQPSAGAGAQNAAALAPAFRAATETVTQKLTVYVDDDPVEITAPGPGHTMGDVYVFFPKQRTVSAGDLYMYNACPAMDQGSGENWVKTLDAIMALPADHFVPGHFEVGTRADFTRFRDYMSDLTKQVAALVHNGASAAEVREKIDMKKYSDFQQFPQFHATFADNAEAIYHQMQPAH
jgi:glyoxylase-like metal-dependent hydrolase (beta-lactamase superfamily II)